MRNPECVSKSDDSGYALLVTFHGASHVNYLNRY